MDGDVNFLDSLRDRGGMDGNLAQGDDGWYRGGRILRGDRPKGHQAAQVADLIFSCWLELWPSWEHGNLYHMRKFAPKRWELHNRRLP